MGDWLGLGVLRLPAREVLRQLGWGGEEIGQWSIDPFLLLNGHTQKPVQGIVSLGPPIAAVEVRVRRLRLCAGPSRAQIWGHDLVGAQLPETRALQPAGGNKRHAWIDSAVPALINDPRLIAIRWQLICRRSRQQDLLLQYRNSSTSGRARTDQIRQNRISQHGLHLPRNRWIRW
jgi:hypothetical protein